MSSTFVQNELTPAERSRYGIQEGSSIKATSKHDSTNDGSNEMSGKDDEQMVPSNDGSSPHSSSLSSTMTGSESEIVEETHEHIKVHTLLDGGASGEIVTIVNSAEEASRAIFGRPRPWSTRRASYDRPLPNVQQVVPSSPLKGSLERLNSLPHNSSKTLDRIDPQPPQPSSHSLQRGSRHETPISEVIVPADPILQSQPETNEAKVISNSPDTKSVQASDIQLYSHVAPQPKISSGLVSGVARSVGQKKQAFSKATPWSKQTHASPEKGSIEWGASAQTKFIYHTGTTPEPSISESVKEQSESIERVSNAEPFFSKPLNDNLVDTYTHDEPKRTFYQTESPERPDDQSAEKLESKSKVAIVADEVNNLQHTSDSLLSQARASASESGAQSISDGPIESEQLEKHVKSEDITLHDNISAVSISEFNTKSKNLFAEITTEGSEGSLNSHQKSATYDQTNDDIIVPSTPIIEAMEAAVPNVESNSETLLQNDCQFIPINVISSTPVPVKSDSGVEEKQASPSPMESDASRDRSGIIEEVTIAAPIPVPKGKMFETSTTPSNFKPTFYQTTPIPDDNVHSQVSNEETFTDEKPNIHLIPATPIPESASTVSSCEEEMLKKNIYQTTPVLKSDAASLMGNVYHIHTTPIPSPISREENQGYMDFNTFEDIYKNKEDANCQASAGKIPIYNIASTPYLAENEVYTSHQLDVETESAPLSVHVRPEASPISSAQMSPILLQVEDVEESKVVPDQLSESPAFFESHYNDNRDTSLQKIDEKTPPAILDDSFKRNQQPSSNINDDHKDEPIEKDARKPTVRELAAQLFGSSSALQQKDAQDTTSKTIRRHSDEPLSAIKTRRTPSSPLVEGESLNEDPPIQPLRSLSFDSAKGKRFKGAIPEHVFTDTEIDPSQTRGLFLTNPNAISKDEILNSSTGNVARLAKLMMDKQESTVDKAKSRSSSLPASSKDGEITKQNRSMSSFFGSELVKAASKMAPKNNEESLEQNQIDKISDDSVTKNHLIRQDRSMKSIFGLELEAAAASKSQKVPTEMPLNDSSDLSRSKRMESVHYAIPIGDLKPRSASIPVITNQNVVKVPERKSVSTTTVQSQPDTVIDFGAMVRERVPAVFYESKAGSDGTTEGSASSSINSIEHDDLNRRYPTRVSLNNVKVTETQPSFTAIKRTRFEETPPPAPKSSSSSLKGRRRSGPIPEGFQLPKESTTGDLEKTVQDDKILEKSEPLHLRKISVLAGFDQLGVDSGKMKAVEVQQKPASGGDWADKYYNRLMSELIHQEEKETILDHKLTSDLRRQLLAIAESTKTPIEQQDKLIVAGAQNQRALDKRLSVGSISQSTRILQEEAQKRIHQCKERYGTHDQHGAAYDWSFWEGFMMAHSATMGHLGAETKELLIRQTRKHIIDEQYAGIPAPLRRIVWPLLVGGGGSISGLQQAQALHLAAEYNRLCQELSPWNSKIEHDVASVFPASEQYTRQRDALGRVLKAYSIYDADVGHAPGLAFVGGILVLFMEEEETAFAMLVSLMFRYDLRRQFHQTGLAGLAMRIFQFERLLQDHLPGLSGFLEGKEIRAEQYFGQPLLTLFAYRYPLEMVGRLYDWFLIDGFVALHSVALAVMEQQSKEKLMQTENLREHLADPNWILVPFAGDNAGGIFKAATPWATKITQERLLELQQEFYRLAQASYVHIGNAQLSAQNRQMDQLLVSLDGLLQSIQEAMKDQGMLRQQVLRYRSDLTDYQHRVHEMLLRLHQMEGVMAEEQVGRLQDSRRHSQHAQTRIREMEEQISELERDLVLTKLRLADAETARDQQRSLPKAKA